MLTCSWRAHGCCQVPRWLSLGSESPGRHTDCFRPREAVTPGCWKQSRIWEILYYFLQNMNLQICLSHAKCCWVLELLCLRRTLSTIQNDGITWSQSLCVHFKVDLYRKKWEHIALSFINTSFLFFLGYAFLWQHSKFNAGETGNESTVLAFQPPHLQG